MTVPPLAAGVPWLAGVVVAGWLGAALLVALLVRDLPNRDRIDRALRPYDENARAARPAGAVRPLASLISLANFGPTLDRLGRLARLGTLLDWLEVRLDQSDLAVRPAEALLAYGAVLASSAAVAVAVAGALGLVVVLVIACIPPAALTTRARSRLRHFNAQLPDALILTASSLKAGYSFLQGVEAVAQEVRQPMAAELRRVMVEAQLGRPIEEALQDCARRMRSVDFEWAVRAVVIQREVGGNLAELLETVAETMVERERLRREVRSLTAEGRMSATVLALLPVLVGVALYVVNPSYLEVLVDHTGGQIALGAAAIGMVVGIWWMSALIDIKV